LLGDWCFSRVAGCRFLDRSGRIGVVAVFFLE
jgi:hypothetical protein